MLQPILHPAKIADNYTQKKLTSAGFSDIDTKLVLEGESTTFCHNMMGAVDSTGNCLLCNANYTAMGVPIIIYPTSNELLALKRASELFNKLIIQEFQGEAPPTYSMTGVQAKTS